MLKSVAYRRIAGEDQQELDLGLADETQAGAGGPSGVKIVGMRMGPLIDALTSIYKALGFDEATGGDEVFYQQVLARLVEPTSKYDSLRVIEEIGLDPVSYATVKRRLPGYAAKEFQAACPGPWQPGRIWVPTPWCFSLSALCILRRIGLMGSANQDFRRSGAWSRR